MRQVVIGAVATQLPQAETPRRPSGHAAISNNYVEALQRAGARVVLFCATEGSEPTPPEELLEGVDGLCLIGGGDLAPSTYGQETHAEAYGFSTARDALELSLARYALANDVPMLAICRGCQVVNVARGGTLHQHLGDVEGMDEESHGRPRQLVIGMHPVTASAGSAVAEAVGGLVADRCTSAHHQSVDRVGAGLRVTATSPDGCVEALEPVDTHSFAVAVQWHPEITAGSDAQQQGLFDALVAAAAERRDAGRSAAPHVAASA
ncbi:MAG: gamma-glutamyl-gamma-aminobutyrate hydrolase family protein [Acidimicrobiales bacterium]